MTKTTVSALTDGNLLILATDKDWNDDKPIVHIVLTDNEALALKRQINKTIADKERQ